MKKILSLILCVIMVMAIVPMTVAAEGELEEVVAYENHFDTSAEFDDYTEIGSEGVSFDKTNKMIDFAGFKSNNGNAWWKRTVDVTGTQGKIRITARIIAKAYSAGSALAINGVRVVGTAGSGSTARLNIPGIEGTLQWDVTAAGKDVSQGVNIDVVVDIATGIATVSVFDGSKKTRTVNVGQIGDTVDIKFGSSGRRAWKADDLVVYKYVAPAQEEPAIDPVCTMRVGGHQTSVVDENGKYNVRFVGVLSDLPAGSEKVGFEIKAPAFDKTWENLSTNTVYYSLKANFGAETITAEKCGGKYITAAAITGIPEATGEIEFVVTPYVVFMIDGVETKIYGETVTVSDVHPSVAE